MILKHNIFVKQWETLIRNILWLVTHRDVAYFKGKYNSEESNSVYGGSYFHV